MVKQFAPPVTLSVDDPRRDDLLAHIVVSRRSTLTNDALAIARAGEDRPVTLLATLIARSDQRITQAERYDDRLAAYDWADTLAVLTGHRAEALAFSTWCVNWAAASLDERALVKAARGESHRQAYLDTQPATGRQIDYLRGLGYGGEIRSKCVVPQLR